MFPYHIFLHRSISRNGRGVKTNEHFFLFYHINMCFSVVKSVGIIETKTPLIVKAPDLMGGEDDVHLKVFPFSIRIQPWSAVL